MGRRHVDETDERCRRREEPGAEKSAETACEQRCSFPRDVETTGKTENKTSEENKDGVTRG